MQSVKGQQDSCSKLHLMLTSAVCYAPFNLETESVAKTLPAPAKASKSSPFESLRKMTLERPSGENSPARLLGKDRSETSGLLPLGVAEKLRALPGWLPTSASPIPTTTSPSSSPFCLVTGLAVCSTNAYSAGTTCNEQVDSLMNNKQILRSVIQRLSHRGLDWEKSVLAVGKAWLAAN